VFANMKVTAKLGIEKAENPTLGGHLAKMAAQTLKTKNRP